MIVLGYVGEPFLRFDRFGVAANVRLGDGARPAARLRPEYPSRRSEWALVSAATASRGRTRVPGRPGPRFTGARRSRWTVPIVVDGQRVDLAGELTKASKPPLWPWLLLGALPLVSGGRRGQAETLVVGRCDCGLAALAGLRDAGQPDAASHSAACPSRPTAGCLFAVEVDAHGGRARVLTRPRARLIAIAALAAFAVLQSLSELAVFRHGIVVSGLPAYGGRVPRQRSRLGAGLGAAGLVFLAPIPAGRKSRSGLTPVRTSRKEQA